MIDPATLRRVTVPGTFTKDGKQEYLGLGRTLDISRYPLAMLAVQNIGTAPFVSSPA